MSTNDSNTGGVCISRHMPRRWGNSLPWPARFEPQYQEASSEVQFVQGFSLTSSPDWFGEPSPNQCSTSELGRGDSNPASVG